VEPPPKVVLLVEDDPDHAELVARAVADERGLRLVHLGDGETVLAYLGREGPWADPASSPRPDLVLLDLRLPGMEGREVLRHLRESPATRDVPVIVMTTAEARDDEQVAVDAPSGYAVKPIDGERFRRLVQEVVAHWTGRGKAGP
jgi:two-component system response regulator